MLPDLDQRLLQAAEQAARQAKLQRRVGELDAEQQEAAATARRLESQLAKEQHDVERLEGTSLTGLFYSILGSKEEQLQKERQEALAAQLKYAVAARQQESLVKELEQARRELEGLAGAAAQHEALLRQKEAAISTSAGEGARELLQFSEREQAMNWQLVQLREAVAAGRHADAALARVEHELGSAQNWGTWDMLGGGMIATAIKHGHIDDAQRAAHDAQQALSAFRRELKDVATEIQVDQIAIDGFSKFADYFFDGLIADWIVQSRINESLASVRRNRDEVSGLVESLGRRLAEADADLEALRQERAAYIEQYRG